MFVPLFLHKMGLIQSSMFYISVFFEVHRLTTNSFVAHIFEKVSHKLAARFYMHLLIRFCSASSQAAIK